MEKSNISPTPITSSKQKTTQRVVFCLELQRKGVGAATRHMPGGNRKAFFALRLVLKLPLL